jgi:hypothetical protein
MFENAFVDARLDRRADLIMQAMSQRKSAVVHQCCPTAKEQTGAYRFFGNSDVTEAEIATAFGRQCMAQLRGRHVLAIHDTSSVDFQAHAGRLSNQDSAIGPLETAFQVGFFVHPVLVVDAVSAFPLGYASVHLWSRPWSAETKTERRYKRQSFEEKESFRWVDAVQRNASVLDEAEHVTVIADRESDIFEVFAQVPNDQTDVLIRVAQNRCVDEEPGKLFDALTAAPCQGRYQVEISATPTRQARTAMMEVRWRAVTLHRPATASQSLPKTVALWALETCETPDSVPVGETPICWRLLTTHRLATFAMALTVIQWYQWRWIIEELFRVLKRQGLNIEASELEGGAALRKNCLLALGAALPILQLTLERDGTYGVASTVVFTEDEMAYQRALGPTLEGQTQKQQNPFAAGTLAWSSWIIGRLGGWKGYRSQSPPGYITMKRGLERFACMFAGWQLAQQVINNTYVAPSPRQEKDVYRE